MGEPNHYEKLGVGEDASFEEIQEAKERLVKGCSDDRKQVEAIEAAYDAILMDRLRLRQEGKIKVPDRIRFPERSADPPPEFTPAAPKQSPTWLQQFIDTPTRGDILLPAGLMLASSILSLSSPPLALALGVGFSLYFLNRKERRFGRALLLTLAGLIIGVVVGSQLAEMFSSQLAQLKLALQSFAAIVTLILLWLVSSFLR